MKTKTLCYAACAALLFAGVSVAQQCPNSQQHSQTVAVYVSHQEPAEQAQADIVDTAVAAGSFKTLVAAAKAAGLVDTLKSKGPLTILAPTDDAFSKLPEGTVENLLKEENREQLKQILTYHVIAGNVKSTDVVKLKEAKTAMGEKIKITVKGDTVMFNESKLLKADIACSNGVIHVIDSVLIPGQDSGTETSQKKDIVDTAVGAGKFNTLVAAVKAAGLVETLKGEGPFTVFAPTDEAFKKIPAETLEMLLKPENKEKLQAILTYHVVSGDVRAADVVKLQKAKTVNGQEVDIKVTDENGVMIDGAKVIKTDIECGNGVIHVIDTVIMPE
ncbi:Immunogenic protein MPT70 precursor [Mariniblastus fucicola]|uniref:Immunogenic protein MPT70 n=1 Tax=Mariniblastus fucicola TaxID=980251 RepID=A0A5B9PK51_9BACT|nr:Immunogenic protein MPT70 precursor [Mariniblastus fucicola]